MGCIFFVFSFFAKNEEFLAIFREKRRKNEKKSNVKSPDCISGSNRATENLNTPNRSTCQADKYSTPKS